ncbi:glutamine transporter permease GlnP [Salmonella enterica subsp. arizonae]|uniref:Glutamine transporter permease GlnP n=1 Tax=Salmonella enterica subsp. arizonae TaxID=59203 RepID=A0A379TDD2_SALER|nr:glutamine transporter permease GlnP [Salmonella enterica subsp. arizonae]
MILPLALRRMLPPLGNQWIISIKDTSLFIVIGVAELTRQGQEIIAGNFSRSGNLERRSGLLFDYYAGAELYFASS